MTKVTRITIADQEDGTYKLVLWSSTVMLKVDPTIYKSIKEAEAAADEKRMELRMGKAKWESGQEIRSSGKSSARFDYGKDDAVVDGFWTHSREK